MSTVPSRLSAERGGAGEAGERGCGTGLCVCEVLLSKSPPRRVRESGWRHDTPLLLSLLFCQVTPPAVLEAQRRRDPALSRRALHR